MASVKGWFGATLGRLLLVDSRVTQVRDLTAHLRLVDVAGESLRAADWHPGDKAQVFLPASTEMRTYTPFAWDRAAGTARFLVFVHGEGPGAAWGRSLRVGDAFRFFGPSRSVDLPALARPIVLFGDETSFAIARALQDLAGDDDRAFRIVCEVSAFDESTTALAALGVRAELVEKTPDDAHLERVTQLLSDAVKASPHGTVVLTGRAQSIQKLRKALRARHVTVTQATKAYWSIGKAGLD